jgi:hypothetical protein
MRLTSNDVTSEENWHEAKFYTGVQCTCGVHRQRGQNGKQLLSTTPDMEVEKESLLSLVRL